MKIDGKHYTTVWRELDCTESFSIIDQRTLPHKFVIEELSSVAAVAAAIQDMHVRGAPAIGATACYGMFLAFVEAKANQAKNSSEEIEKAVIDASKLLAATRPTAVNLFFGIDAQLVAADFSKPIEWQIENAIAVADAFAKEERERSRQIGLHGVSLLEEISKKKDGEVVNILTHCNAGWLACVDYGTATAPIYEAHERGIPVHVWVDETRPRNQGARLTAWELGQHGIPHTVIVDNAGGHLMQHGLVDIVIVGSDRTTARGDVGNKIGTYLKALAAADNEVPFYVALPSSTIDWAMQDGVAEMPIEKRGGEEVSYIHGRADSGEITRVLLTPEKSAVANYAFDVTPARFVKGLITERGVCAACPSALKEMYPKLSSNV
jgi:methylthioribose-1-phosphate isomerase